MAEDWYVAVDHVQPHVVHISTPRGSGTGFLLARIGDAAALVIATASHVVDSAHYWGEPIRIYHPHSKGSILLREADRSIILNTNDTAAVVFSDNALKLPKAPLPLLEAKTSIKVGTNIGWYGFPAISDSPLCFFGGRVSARMKRDAGYLVDGVAINGVSGGPAFYIEEEEKNDAAVIMGVVSAYYPNRNTGETLPGLALVRDVSELHNVISGLKSFEQAKKQESPLPASPPPDTSSQAPTRVDRS